MMMFQIISAVDHKHRKVLVRCMWDSGANLTMITQDFSTRLKLPKTGRSSKIFLADGIVQSCPTVKMYLVDRNDNLHLLEAAVVPTIGHKEGLRSIDPKIFNMSPDDFTMVNGPVDVLISHIRPSLFPAANCLKGESCLYRSFFGSGWLCVSAEGLVEERPIVCKAIRLESKSMDFLNYESLGIQPPPWGVHHRG